MPTSRVEAAAEGMPLAQRTVDDLLATLASEAQVCQSLERRRKLAEEALPTWAASGPDRINNEGQRFGNISGWPEIANVVPPTGMGFRYIRYGPRHAFDEAMFLAPKLTDLRPIAVAARRKYRLAAFERVRTVIARRREQEAEMERVGLSQIDTEIERTADWMGRIQDELDARATGNDDASVILRLVMAVIYGANQHYPLDDWSGEQSAIVEVLGRMAERVDGFLHVVAKDIGSAGDRTFDETIIGGAPVRDLAS